jgi:hypothetical protein
VLNSSTGSLQREELKLEEIDDLLAQTEYKMQQATSDAEVLALQRKRDVLLAQRARLVNQATADTGAGGAGTAPTSDGTGGGRGASPSSDSGAGGAGTVPPIPTLDGGTGGAPNRDRGTEGVPGVEVIEDVENINNEKVEELVHSALDIAGLSPGAVGVFADGANAYLYAKEGDWANAGISLASVVFSLGPGALLVLVLGRGLIRISKTAIAKRGAKATQEWFAKAFKRGRLPARLVSASRKSLDDFLERVWTARAEIGMTRDKKKVLDLFQEATEANPLTRSLDNYKKALEKVKAERTGGKTLTTGGFHHFDREGFDMSNPVHLASIKERIYLNVDANSAPEVLQKIIKDIIDNREKFPGVPKVKLAIEASIGKRPEGIVIYTQSKESADMVLKEIKAYQKQNPAHFKTSTPPMTEPVSPGISVGSEPIGSVGDKSFGGERSRAIQEALRESVRNNETQEQFKQRVLECFRQHGIDPDNPHLNLTPGDNR